MFDIVYSLLFDFINLLKWYIPILLVFGIIAILLRQGGRR